MPGTVNPTLTFLLALLFLAMFITITALAVLLSRSRRDMHTARGEARRVAGRHKAAQARAGEAEDQAARLMVAVEGAIATARQAVSNTDQLEIVSRQLGELFAYVTEPLEEGAGRGPQPIPDTYPAGDYRQQP
jgi:hypothetical protein